MKISTSSWHYRLLKRMGNTFNPHYMWDPPSSLCSYFWSFPGHALRLTFISFIIALAVSYLPICLYAWLVNGSPNAKVIVLVTLAVVGVLGAIFGIVAISDCADRKESGAYYVVREFIKAKKSRVCPLITYVSSEAEHVDSD